MKFRYGRPFRAAETGAMEAALFLIVRAPYALGVALVNYRAA